MWRWTIRILVGLVRAHRRCRALRRHVPMACDSKGPRGDSASRTISSTSEGTGCICGAPGTARLPSSSTRDSAARVLTGASSNLMLLDSRVSAPTTGQVWVTAIPARRRGPHAASRASWPNSSTAAGLPDRWCSSGPPSRVSTSVCSRPITLSAPQVSCSWMPPTKTTHMKCRRWRDLFRCCRRSVSFDCSACRSVRDVESLAPSVRQFAQATSFRAAGYQAAADEIIHIRESAVGSQELAPEAHHPCPRRHRWTRSRRELATVATRSSLAVRTRMSDDRSTVRSRRADRPTRGRCGRDPDCRGDSQRPRCPPLRHACGER